MEHAGKFCEGPSMGVTVRDPIMVWSKSAVDKVREIENRCVTAAMKKGLEKDED
jgi:hypothetical protein